MLNRLKRHRSLTLFSRSFSTANLSITRLAYQANPIKIAASESKKERLKDFFKREYPTLKWRTFDTEGKIVYRLCDRSPDELLKDGCFTPSTKEPWWNSDPYAYDFGNNGGMVCFSFLPEITTLFAEKIKKENKPPFLYAYQLKESEGEIIFPGGQWRQVCVAGELAIRAHDFLVGRELISIGLNNKVMLGPLISLNSAATKLKNDLATCCQLGERFQDYCENRLIRPFSRYYSEGEPPEYEIMDTPYTKKHQEIITAYYQEKFQEMMCKESSLRF